MRDCLRSISVVLATLALLGGVADAAIYKYVDRDGVSHFTDAISQVPPEYRHQAKDISSDMDDMTGFHVVEGLNGEKPAAEDSGAAMIGVDDLNLGDFGGSEIVSGVLESMGFGVILLFLLAIPVLYVIGALIFKLACRIGGEEPPGLGRACGILFVQGLAGSAVGAAVTGVAIVVGIDVAATTGGSIAVSGASAMLSWVANGAILASMMSYGLMRSMWIGVLHTLLLIVMIGGPIGAVTAVVILAS